MLFFNDSRGKKGRVSPFASAALRHSYFIFPIYQGAMGYISLLTANIRVCVSHVCYVYTYGLGLAWAS